MVMATIVVFMLIGRPFDQFLYGYHIPAIIGSIAIVVMFFTKWVATLRTRAGVPFVLFLVVMCFAALFSLWRGGSAVYVQQYVELNLVLFCLLGAAPQTVGQVRWLALVALFSCIFNVAAGAAFDATGRLYLTDDTFGNSDDVALLGGFCIPFVLLLAGRLGKVFGSLVGVAGVVACLALVELSAARFALISLAVMAILYFLRGSAGRRVAVLVAVCVLVLGSVFLLPKSTRDRLATITSVMDNEEDQDLTSEAIGSMHERQQLVKDAMQAFLTHPILGVGPDVFIDWRFDTLHRRGQPSHNTYLQSAAEEGIFGVIFYVAFLVGSLTMIRRSVKPFEGWEDGRAVALSLEASMIYFVTSAFFITSLSHAHQFLLAGLAVALDRLRVEQVAASPEPLPEGAASENAPQFRPTQVLPRPLRPRPLPSGRDNNPATTPARPVRYRFNRPVARSGKE